MARTSILSEELVNLLHESAAQMGSSRPLAFIRPDARWREAILITVALWLFVVLIYLPIMLDRHQGQSWTSVALDASTVIVSMIFGLGIFAVFRGTMRWPAEARVIALSSAVVGAAIAQTAFDFTFTGWVAQNLEESWRALPRNLRYSYGAAFNYMCVFAVNLALFQLALARHREVNRERQLAEAHWAAQQAQLMALRFQLNPHFLFNTLNAISAMIVTGRNEDAEEMTDRLSSFLRTSLRSDPTELVPLETELGLIEEYLEIESIRFGERLSVEIPCTDAAAGVLVPSFLLQPLVENAIKYGVGPSLRPVTVRISATVEGEVLVLSIADNGASAPDRPKPEGMGVGLQNVQRRLAAIYGDAASLAVASGKTGYVATIRLPMNPPPPMRYERIQQVTVST